MDSRDRGSREKKNKKNKERMRVWQERKGQQEEMVDLAEEKKKQTERAVRKSSGKDGSLWG